MLTGEISNNGSSDIPSHPQHIRKKLYFAKNCHVFPVKYSSFLESIDQEVEWYEWTGRMRCVNKEECPGCRIYLVRFTSKTLYERLHGWRLEDSLGCLRHNLLHIFYCRMNIFRTWSFIVSFQCDYIENIRTFFLLMLEVKFWRSSEKKTKKKNRAMAESDARANQKHVFFFIWP